MQRKEPGDLPQAKSVPINIGCRTNFVKINFDKPIDKPCSAGHLTTTPVNKVPSKKNSHDIGSLAFSLIFSDRVKNQSQLEEKEKTNSLPNTTSSHNENEIKAKSEDKADESGELFFLELGDNAATSPTPPNSPRP